MAGEGKNTVLLLAGGPSSPPESLKHITDYVSKDNKTILLHQRGTGLSANAKINSETMTVERFVDDINNVLKKENVNRTFIIGHSWGAIFTFDFMAKNPEKVQGLVLIGNRYNDVFMQRNGFK